MSNVGLTSHLTFGRSDRLPIAADSIDNALDIIHGDLAADTAGDIEKDEPVVGLVEYNYFFRIIEEIVDLPLVEDRHTLALRLRLSFGINGVIDAKITVDVIVSLWFLLPSVVPKNTNKAAARIREVVMGRFTPKG